MTELSCAELAEQINAFLDDELDPGTATLLAAHVAECATCSYRLADTFETIEMCRSLPPEPLPPRLEGKLIAAFRSWRDHGDTGVAPR